MYRYGLYARKSDDDRSVTEKSIKEQRDECMKIALRDGLFVVNEWEESKTAKVPGVRPKWDELIRRVESGHINAVLCWHINRLVRNMEEGGKLVQLFVEGKIKQIRTPHATYNTGDNILPLVIEAASATQYSIDLSHTVTRALDGNFRSGNCNYRVPQGYRNARSPVNLKRGIVEVDPERFPLIRKAWTMMLTGAYAPADIIKYLNTVHGYRTRITKKGGNRPLAHSAAYKMFSNPFYMGLVRYKGETVPGNHTAMVTPDEFARVQELLRGSSFAAPHVLEHSFTGIMRCAFCGYMVTAERKRLKNDTLWSIYHCCDPKGSCTKEGIAARTVERRIAGELENLVIDRHYLEIVSEVMLKSLEAPATESAEELAAIEAQLGRIDERLKNLEEMGLNGLISSKERFFELQNRELEEKQRLLVERERLRTETARMRENARRASRFIAFAPAEFGQARPNRQREIARSLAHDYRFDGRKKDISLNVEPVLTEVVRFARSQAQSIEPPKTGSQKQKEPALAGSVLGGGRNVPEIELPAALLTALRGPLFPELDFDEH